MLITNKKLKLIIRKSIAESLNDKHRSFLLEAEHSFTADKNVKPGEQLSFGTSNKSFKVLAKSKYERIGERVRIRFR